MQQFDEPTLPADDFRHRAASESQRIVKSHPRPIATKAIDPATLGQSLCVPIAGGEGLLRRAKILAIAMFVLGIIGIGGGGIIAATHSGDEKDIPTPVLITMCIFSAGGFICLFGGVFCMRWIVRRHIARTRPDYAHWRDQADRLPVGIEHALTFDKIKAVPEDLGLLVIEPKKQLVRIEGVRCRYIVHGRDVISIKHQAGASSAVKGVSITYRVGTVTLSITVSTDSIWDELRRQTIGLRQNPLFPRLSDALLPADEVVLA